jgi:hypothetical protein
MFLTIVVEKIKTQILCSVILKKNRTVYEIVWKNTVERGGPQIIWRRRFACYVPKAANTHSGFVILNAFP